MAVAHRRQCCPTFEAAHLEPTGYSFFLRPDKGDETMEECHGVFTVTITPQSCQLSWAPPTICSCIRERTSCERLAITLHALEAQVGDSINLVMLNASLVQAVRKHSGGYRRARKQSDIIAYIPWRGLPSCAAGESSVGLVVHLFSCIRLDFSLQPVTTSPHTLLPLGPFHSQQFRHWGKTGFSVSGGDAERIQTMSDLPPHEDAVEPWNNISPSQHVNDAKEFRQHSQADAQDNWVFYDYYPQIMSLLGEKPIERRAYRNPVTSFEYPLECDDDSCNDSGIDIGTYVRNLQGLHDNECQSARIEQDSTVWGQRWSVDEMIAISLLEALESRGRANIGRARRRESSISTVKGRVTSLRWRIAKVFRKFRLA